MIKVNHDLCIGCGACASVCPSHFQLNDEGKADAIDQTLTDCVTEAVESCPVAAITQ